MFKIRKNFMGLLMAFAVVVLAMPVQLQAAGSTTIRVSDGEPSVGDGVSVNVIASESDSVSVKYNAEVLQLTGSSVEYTTDGNTITFQGTDATFKFKAIASGKSSIIVSGSNVTGSSTSIQVGEGGGEAAEPEQTTDNTTGDEEGQFTLNGTAYVVSERFGDEEIPVGFEKIRVTIDGYAYKALSNGSLTLVYLKPAADTSGKGIFYVYNEQTNEVSDFAMLGEGSHYILLATPESMPFEGMEQTEITVSNRNVSVYSLGGGQEFYYAYGTNAQGQTGWYQYDTTDGSLQRVNMQLVGVVTSGDDADTVSQDSDAYYDKWSKQRYLLAALLFVIVVLLVLVINLFLSRRRDRYDDWEEDDEDEFDEDPAEEDMPVQLSLEETSSDHIPQVEIPTIEIPDVSDEEASEVEISALDLYEVETLVADAEEKKKPAKPENNIENDKEQNIYKNIKGTEAFRSSKETRYKTNADDQIDILDLNDL